MKKRGTIREEPISVRRYRKSDRVACRGLWRQLAEKHAEIYSDPSIAGPRVEDSFDEHLRNVGPRMIWVATCRSKVIGFVGLMNPPDSPEDREIEPLVVHSDYRGRGIGRRLADAAKKEAAIQGAKYITVRPVARNKEALEFFREEGFDKIGRVELFIDLKGRKWKKGISLHGFDFRF